MIDHYATGESELNCADKKPSELIQSKKRSRLQAFNLPDPLRDVTGQDRATRRMNRLALQIRQKLEEIESQEESEQQFSGWPMQLILASLPYGDSSAAD